MAINEKIIKRIKAKTEDNPTMRRLLPSFLARVEEGKQPKKLIARIMDELKSTNNENRIY